MAEIFPSINFLCRRRSMTHKHYFSPQNTTTRLPDLAPQCSPYLDQSVYNLQAFTLRGHSGIESHIKRSKKHRMVIGESQFNPMFTKKMPFHITQSDTVSVDMMMKKKNFKHGVMKELGFSFLELPYKGNDLSMMILLPDKKDGLPALENIGVFHMLVCEKALSPDTLQKIPRSFGYPEEVEVIFPKFRIETSFDLEKTLSIMGMKDLFMAGKANLSAIDELNSIHVSNVVHKAFVEVNEEST
ncbi:hypothetical protein ScPMuIL_009744 [Solemya velum]